MPFLVSCFVGAQLFTGFCALLFILNRHAVAGRVAHAVASHPNLPGSPAMIADQLHEFMPSQPNAARRYNTQAA